MSSFRSLFIFKSKVIIYRFITCNGDSISSSFFLLHVYTLIHFEIFFHFFQYHMYLGVLYLIQIINLEWITYVIPIMPTLGNGIHILSNKRQFSKDFLGIEIDPQIALFKGAQHLIRVRVPSFGVLMNHEFLLFLVGATRNLYV